MAYKTAAQPTTEEAALETLRQRVRTITIACENLAAAESKTPPDDSGQIENSEADHLVNAGNTPTDSSSASSQLTSRPSLSQIYDAMGKTR